MVRKLLNPIYVGTFILVLVLGSLAHLMYGSCQTTKYHYIAQRYWMPDYLPEWLLKNNRHEFGNLIVDDNFTGKWIDWYKNGYRECEGYYVNGKETGILLGWNNEGVLLSKDNYKNGRLDGLCESWYENGNKYGVTRYLNDNEHGIQTWWFINNNKKMELTFKNNMQISGLYWLPDGTLYKKEYFGESGNFEKREFFEHKKIIKTETKQYPISYLFFYENGEKKILTSLDINDDLEGVQTEWYENGNLESKTFYLKKKPSGLQEFWNKDGTLKEKEYYDDKGNFQKRERFEKGKLVKTETEE